MKRLHHNGKHPIYIYYSMRVFTRRNAWIKNSMEPTLGFYTLSIYVSHHAK